MCGGLWGLDAVGADEAGDQYAGQLGVVIGHFVAMVENLGRIEAVIVGLPIGIGVDKGRFLLPDSAGGAM
jgi:hypothetical protein